jgi:hypothetical protein
MGMKGGDRRGLPAARRSPQQTRSSKRNDFIMNRTVSISKRGSFPPLVVSADELVDRLGMRASEVRP